MTDKKMPSWSKLIILVLFIANVAAAEASHDPFGVWIPADAHSIIVRIHISGSPPTYIATVDYRCATSVCSTFQSLAAEGPSASPTFAVPLGSVGPAPILALRWQKGPPCNRTGSDDNGLAYWTAAINPPSGEKQAHAFGRIVCLVRPPARRRR